MLDPRLQGTPPTASLPQIGSCMFAEVESPEHIQRMLPIIEGFREASAVAGSNPIPAAPVSKPAAPQAVQEAPAPAQDPPPAPATADPGASDWSTVEDADLRAPFEQEVGRKTGPRAGRDTMIAQIEATRRGA